MIFYCHFTFSHVAHVPANSKLENTALNRGRTNHTSLTNNPDLDLQSPASYIYGHDLLICKSCRSTSVSSEDKVKTNGRAEAIPLLAALMRLVKMCATVVITGKNYDQLSYNVHLIQQHSVSIIIYTQMKYCKVTLPSGSIPSPSVFSIYEFFLPPAEVEHEVITFH